MTKIRTAIAITTLETIQHTVSRPGFPRRLFGVFALALAMGVAGVARAQAGGEGGIQGTVLDSTGAAIANAKVTATNGASGLATVRTTSGAGVFLISPIAPGPYTVTVEALGFEKYVQKNVTVDALATVAVNAALTNGAATETVTVTSAPPALETTNATLQTVMENETYANLPLQVNNAQRDPTAFASLVPGAQAGTRVPIVGGTGNYLGQLYLDGMPAETINQQGDNRLVSQGVDLDAVDQFQVVTSTPPAEFSGAGSINFTLKSGGMKYHGQVSDFVRNTIFDAWAFTAKWQQQGGLNPATGIAYPLCVAGPSTQTVNGTVIPFGPRAGCQAKPVEHQNELSATFGSKVPFTHNKVFFFVAYDKFHSRKGPAPANYTIATPLMRTGDFTELNGNNATGGFTGVAGDPSGGGNNPAIIYDPTSNVCTATTCTRTAFQGLKNGIPTYNVIPTSYLSPISLAEQAFLPAPTNPNVVLNNFLGGQPSGFDNHVLNYRVDIDLSKKQRLSSIGAMGTVNYLNNYGAPYLPQPYTGGDLASIYPKVFDVEDAYSITDKLTNQLKFGFTRFFQNIHDSTQGITAYQPATLGITNLPAGQAAQEFPGAAFGTTSRFGTVQTGFTGNSNAISTQLTTPSTYTILDNLQWLKGKHALTFGITVQFQEINNANPATYTGVLDLAYNALSTANFSGTSLSTTTTGYSYASFLLGAVGGTPSIGLQPVSELGGRYHVISPYVEDSWKVTSKLTADLGLRWDYLPPYHEVQDRWTFLNPTQINAATGTPGDLQFAGNYGGANVSCGCRTPVSTFFKNFGPRVGLAYSVDEKTVFRIGFGEVFSQAGGVGGRGGAYQGTGQTGFNTTASSATEVTQGLAAAPSFYLNNGPAFTQKGLANTSLFGPGFAYPANPVPGASGQILNTGNYLNSAGKLVTALGVNYADPYISGRAPEFSFYNVGFQRAVTNNMTLAVNYVGDQSHFLGTGANARGYWANQLNPIYLAGLGPVLDTTGTKPILNAAATPANVARAQAALPGVSIPAFFQAAAGVSTTPTIAQGLTAFPQYSSVTDTWGQNVGNLSYNSLQITLLQRFSHGFSFNVNYTYSKNIGDDGTFRSGFDIPAAAISGGGQSWHQDRLDRSWTGISVPQSLHAFGVFDLPFGKGHIGGNSFLVRTLAGGWQVSTIYTYGSGTPVAVTSSICSATTYPGQGQCAPDINPAYAGGNPRINGSPGSGPLGTIYANLNNIKYVDQTAFSTPQDVSTAPFTSGTHLQQFLIGNAPRTKAYNLNNPSTENVDGAIHRTFALPWREGLSFKFEADVLNAWNKVTFGGPVASYSGATGGTFGQITSASSNPRDWQFAGHLNF